MSRKLGIVVGIVLVALGITAWQALYTVDAREQIRNVPTDIRGWGASVDRFGNSIFIFEVADLCIGHLGHLHHRLSDEDLALIGRLDVVFAPVDGSFTLDLPTMIKVLKDLRASLVIPMHYFGTNSLGIFLAGMSEEFAIQVERGTTIDVALETLPQEPTVLVLGGSERRLQSNTLPAMVANRSHNLDRI